MATQSPESKNTAHEPSAALRLEGGLTVYTVADLRGRMLEQLTDPSGLRLDLGAIDACDCAGLQLLCAARKSALARGKAFELLNEPEAVRTAAEAIGLSAADYSKSLLRV